MLFRSQSPQETRQIATGKIERDPYEEVTLNNQRNEDGNSDRFKPQNVEDLGLLLDNFVDSQVLEEHGMFSDRFNLPKLEDFKFGLNSSQLPDTNSFANDNKLNLSRPHESYDDAYSDKRRKM